MFNAELPLYLRDLSLYHVMLPILVIFMIRRFGYDRRALLAQALLVLVVLPITYLVTEPADNIDLVFGLGPEPQTQTTMLPLLYLALEMILVPVVICLPTHLILRRVVCGRQM